MNAENVHINKKLWRTIAIRHSFILILFNYLRIGGFLDLVNVREGFRLLGILLKLALHKLSELFAVNLFVLDEVLCKLMELIHMIRENFLRTVVSVMNNRAYLLVNLLRKGFRIVLGVAVIPAEENLAAARRIGNGAYPVAHAVLGNHALCKLGRTLDIV